MKNQIIILSLSYAKSQTVQIDSGLVVYYPFNGNAIDESGNGNNGTVYGAILTEDRFGNENAAFWFDGIANYIEVEDNPLLDITTEISIAGWLYKNSDTAWASMVTKGGEDVTDNNYTIQNNENAGVIFTYASENSGGICNSNIIIPLNEWHFVAFTWDGSWGEIYIDGLLDSTSITFMEDTLSPNDFSLYIGVDHPGVTEFFFGSLDDIRIYNRWLNESEIKVLYNGDITNVSTQKPALVSRIKTFPNPFSKKTTIKFKNPNHSKYKLSVFSITGSKVFEQDNITTDKIELKKGNLKPGVYVVELKGEKVFRGKMVIE